MRRSSLAVGLVPFVLALVATLLAPLGTPAAAASGFNLGRLAGADRYATASAIAQAAFPAGAPNAVIATGESFPDALAGGFLAGNLNAPVLLTTPHALSPVTTSTLGALKTKSVTILGGTGAVSQAVENELRATASSASGGGNLTVTRIAGGNRYETARLITCPTTNSAAFREQFRFTRAGIAPTNPSSHSCTGSVLTLTFDAGVLATQGSLTYTEGTVPVEDVAGNDATSPQTIPVT